MTHFCEVHGPKSILCTQVLPLECALCLPPCPILRSQSSDESFTTQVHDGSNDDDSFRPPQLRQTDTNITLPTDFSGASTNVDSEPSSPTLERHPLYPNLSHQFGPQFKYGRAQGETCASCSFTVPKAIAEKLPQGAPGCLQSDGKRQNGAPVLRSREFVCLGKDRDGQSDTTKSQHSSSYGSKSSSLRSRHPANCHDHRLTYLTAKAPENATHYSTLRASVIRTLSCEILPRGMSDGRLYFGDSTAGYTIAYVFRLSDPKARGRRRAYAFVALAGKDAGRASKSAPMVWEAFAAVAKGIEEKAQRFQESVKLSESSSDGKDYTPVTSFLTQRVTDPDGHPRGTRQVPPRSLAEIVGDEHIFTYLHQYFIAVLRCLGDRFGGLPLADTKSIVGEDDGLPCTLHAELAKVRVDNDTTPTPDTKHRDQIEAAKARMNRCVKRNEKCAPIAVSVQATRQVVV